MPQAQNRISKTWLLELTGKIKNWRGFLLWVELNSWYLHQGRSRGQCWRRFFSKLMHY